MPGSPKIQKEEMLKTAFHILVKEGYSAINIKAVANKIGCSTQPISWQFGGMDGLRKELLEYCLTFLKDNFKVKGERACDIVNIIAKGYIDLAFDYPNLYKYLYMSENEGKKMGELARTLRSENQGRIVDMLKEEYDLSAYSAKMYIMNLELYVHGVASYTATGYTFSSKGEIMRMIETASEAFLAACKKN